VVFILYFLVTGQWKPALRSMAAAVAVTIVGFLLLPGPSADYWFDRLFLDASRVGGVEYVGNQSLNGLATRLTGVGVRESLLGVVVVGFVAVAGLASARYLHRRGEVILAIVAMAATGLLISPISWSHHWVWIIPALVVLVDAIFQRRPGALPLMIGVVVMFAALPGIIWRVPQGDGAELHWNLTQQLAGNLYVWLGLIALGIVVMTMVPSVRQRLAITIDPARGERNASAEVEPPYDPADRTQSRI